MRLRLECGDGYLHDTCCAKKKKELDFCIFLNHIGLIPCGVIGCLVIYMFPFQYCVFTVETLRCHSVEQETVAHLRANKTHLPTCQLCAAFCFYFCKTGSVIHCHNYLLFFSFCFMLICGVQRAKGQPNQGKFEDRHIVPRDCSDPALSFFHPVDRFGLALDISIP